MKKLIPLLLLSMAGLLSGCSSRVKNYSVTPERNIDSTFLDCIKEYCVYLESDGDSSFALTVNFSKSADTLSYLINGNALNDISQIIRDSLSYIYMIDGHYVFSKCDIFPNHRLIDFETVMDKMDSWSYEQYKSEGVMPKIKIIWNCKSFYLVVKNEKVLRRELRFISDKPEMWKNNFWN